MTRGRRSCGLGCLKRRIAELTAERCELQGAIESARSTVDQLFENGEKLKRGVATAAFWWSRCYVGDRTPTYRKERLLERLAAVPTDPGSVLNEITLLRLRALLARARGDEASYRDFADRNRAIATGTRL